MREVSAYGALLRNIARTKALQEGRNLHSQLKKSRHDEHTFLGNLLVQMYGSCNRLEEAKASFDNISKRNCFSWNILLTANAQNDRLQQARAVFKKAPQHTLVSMTAMITGFTHKGLLDDARRLFDQMPERCVVSWNAMMVGYAHNGDLLQAMKMFEGTPVKNIVSWNALIGAYVHVGDINQAEKMAHLMPHHDVMCWNSLLTAFTQKGDTEKAKRLFTSMPSKTIVSATAMIEAYSKSGELDRARKLFETMPQTDVVVWTTMVTGYAEHGYLKDARQLFDQMPVKDDVAWSAIISGYTRNGSLDDARITFNELGVKSVSSWNALIAAFTRNGEAAEALNYFKLMDLEGVRADSITFSSVIDACAELTELPIGKIIHLEIIASDFAFDTVVVTSLVSLYARCGLLDYAFELFVGITLQDLFSWNTMIAAYARNGAAKQGLQLLRIMTLEGVNPDPVSFLSVLSACGHEGLAEDCWECFLALRDHGMDPKVEHYVCVVDALARAGRLDAAEELIKSMPFEPNSVQWRSLLGACRVHENVEQAASVAKQVLNFENDDAAPYLLLSHMYSSKTPS